MIWKGVTDDGWMVYLLYILVDLGGLSFDSCSFLHNKRCNNQNDEITYIFSSPAPLDVELNCLMDSELSMLLLLTEPMFM